MIYCPDQAKVLLPFLENQRWLLLGGPGDGNESQFLTQHFPGLRTVAVEPCQSMFEWQEGNGFPDSGTLVNKALYQFSGEGTIKVSSKSPRASSLSLLREGEWEPCQLTTWDELVEEHGPFEDAILWLSVEGCEYPALLGARKLFEEGAISLVNIRIVERFSAATASIDKFLRSHGLHCVKYWAKHIGHHSRIYSRNPRFKEAVPYTPTEYYHQEPVEERRIAQGSTTITNFSCDVVTAYCSADIHYLPISVDSILHQVGVNVVLHLVNDGVPVPDDIGQWWADLPNVRLYRNDPPGIGPYMIVNRIFDWFETDFFAIQDADDIAYPDRLFHSLSLLRDQEAGVVGCSMQQFVDAWSQGESKAQRLFKATPIVTSGYTGPHAPNGALTNGTVVYRKSEYERAGGFANWLCTSDVEFAERLAYCGVKRVFSSRIVADRRLRNDSLSNGSKVGDGTDHRVRMRNECLRRSELYQTREPIDARQLGGLEIERNGIGTYRVN